MTNRHLDITAWPRLSPLLDELIELAPAARAARLADLRLADPALADDLAGLLERLPSLDAAGFLETPALPSPINLAGQAVGAYVLQREIGQGGMGSVWLARRADGRYDGRVAIKFMRSGLLPPGLANRFLREGQLLARLNHPHIAKLLDAGVHQAGGLAPEQPYLVLEYVDGLPIDLYCDTHALDLTARVRLVLAVLAAVAHAHGRLILHRDLKPSNILVAVDGSPKLLDFGVGKLLADAEADAATDRPGAVAERTQFGPPPFTMRYAAPEQVQHRDVTTATDVYAVGVLLYGLLGGGHPTEPADGSPLEQLQAVLDVEPARLSDAVRRASRADAVRRARQLRGDMDTILARALKKDPGERYANAAALANDLQRWLDDEPVLARRDSAAYRAGRFLRRHRRAVLAAGTAGTLALAGGAALALWQAHQARAERAQAEALVGFMLGDLQWKLSQLGRTDLLQSVGERALAYYSDDRLKTMDSASLAGRAHALRVLGDSARQRLDLRQARAALEQAADATERLLQMAPGDIRRLQDHASSLERMVELVDRSGDRDAILALTQRLSALRWRAWALAPQDQTLRLQAWMADQWPAAIMVSSGLEAEGLALLAQVQEGLQALPADLPDMPRARSITLALMGQAQAASGRYAEAANSLRAFAAQQPARHDGVADVRERRENLLMMRLLARTLLDQGELQAAMAVAQQTLTRSESDANQSPDNLILAEELILGRCQLAELQWLAGARLQARRQLDQIAAGLARMADVATDNIDWHVGTLGRVLALRARMQPQPPGPQPVDPAWLAALQTHATHVARLDATGQQLHGGLLTATLGVGLAHGDALLAQGQADAARQRWQAVADRALPAAQKGSHQAVQYRALALLRLDQPQAARPWVAQLQASSWRHPDLADLQQRLAQAERGPWRARAQ